MERLGDYRIVREIGRGGMGVVYEAEQVSLDRHVALKVLSQAQRMDVRMTQRFEREAKAAAKLHHTNIVPVFGVGVHADTPYYVMQFIEGLGLYEVIEELKRLQPLGANASKAGDVTVDGPCHTRNEKAAAEVARSLLTGRFHPSSAVTVDHATKQPSSPSGATGKATSDYRGIPPIAPTIFVFICTSP